MSETIENHYIIKGQPISVRIDNLLNDLPSSPYKPSIFRVSDELRCVNEKLYEPTVLAVGPFHHSKNHLQKMEQHKLRYLKHLLRRRDESSVYKYVMAIESLEEQARRCYAEPIELSRDDFVQMLLLDGIFIIELIRKCQFDGFQERDDTIFQHEQVLIQLFHDLMLVENQVPFFVLDKLFSMTKSENTDDDILYLIRRIIDDISPWPDTLKITGNASIKNIDHLLGLVYWMWCFPVAKAQEDRIWCSSLIWCYSFAKMMASRCGKAEEEKITINSTIELKEAGIKFSKYTKGSNFLDIKFTKGVMKIPQFRVADGTESILRNLIAYEHLFSCKDPKYVTDYAFFWNCLVNTSNDVEILRHHGIVTNLLGDDEMVCRMFNHIDRNIPVSFDNFCYDDVFNKANEHCGNLWNRRMANLRHKYFNSPWACISFSAALVLLVFAFAQTVFSVLSYTKS